MTHPSIISAESPQSIFMYENLVTESIKVEGNKILSGVYINNPVMLGNIVNSIGIQGINLNVETLPVLLEITVTSAPMLNTLFNNLTSGGDKAVICTAKLGTRQGPRGNQLVLSVDFPNFLIVDTSINGTDINGFMFDEQPSIVQEPTEPVYQQEQQEVDGFKSPKQSYEKPKSDGFNINISDF